MLIAHLRFFRERKKLLPSIWSDLNIKEVEFLPHDIDGHSAFKLKYDSNNLMKSTKATVGNVKQGRIPWDTQTSLLWWNL